MSNDPEEFKDYEEPIIDNTIINNLIQAVFNPSSRQSVLRNNTTFSQHLNSRDTRSSIWDEISNINIYNEIENEIENENEPYQNISIADRLNNINMRSSIWHDFNDFNDDEQEFNLTDMMINFFSPIMVDPIDFIAEQSFEADQEDYVKSDYNLIIESYKYITVKNDIRNDNKECTICTVDYEEDCMVSITKCKHIFHTECIKEWAKYKQVCPVCRAVL
jgi:hypothetical protein